MSSAYLRLLIFLLAIWIPACASSSPVFLMMYSAYKLNKQGGNNTVLMYSFSYLETVCCSMSSSNCCFVPCIQVSQESGQVVWYSHLFQNCPQFIVTHTIKGFGIVNKAEIDAFLELSCFFNALTNLNLEDCFSHQDKNEVMDFTFTDLKKASWWLNGKESTCQQGRSLGWKIS